MGFGVNGFGSLGPGEVMKRMTERQQRPEQPKKTEQKDTDAYIQSNKKVDKAASTESKVELSEGAQKVLDELKEKFGNTDFYVADFANDEEAGQILSNSTKEFGVVIKPDELEKMASDAEYKDKIFSVIQDGQEKLNEFRDNLSDEEKGSIKRVGMSIGDDGKVSYFAELIRSNKEESERIQKEREEKAEAKKEEEKAEKKKAEQEKLREKFERPEPVIHKYIQADSLDDLASKLSDFLNSDEATLTATRPHFDFKA